MCPLHKRLIKFERKSFDTKYIRNMNFSQIPGQKDIKAKAAQVSKRRKSQSCPALCRKRRMRQYGSGIGICPVYQL
jgi:hypothetical protein